MGSLRVRLQQTSPELLNLLEQSWKIAVEQWLGVITPSKGSFNSYPHLENVENYLDEVISRCELSPSPAKQIALSAPETYLLLSAVLFHDVGRCLSTENDSKSHGELTRDFLLNQYAHVGIPSLELARSLGNICHYHDPAKGKQSDIEKKRKEVESKLKTTVIDPYGEIREHLIAALLTLADTMDATFNRSLPIYLFDDTRVGPVGLFRRYVRGVYADPVTQMVRTVLISGNNENKDPLPRMFLKRAGDGPDYNKKWQSLWTCTNFIKGLQAKPDLTIKKLNHDIYFSAKEPKTTAKAAPKTLLYRLTEKEKLSRRTMLILQFTAMGWLQLGEEKEKDLECHSKHYIPMAMAFADVRKNAAVLNEIQGVLASTGLLLKSWVLEYEEHLFNALGFETYEPLFQKEYLLWVAEKMWQLSTGIFGTSVISYEDLASCVGDFNLDKVRKAVRRIAIVSESLVEQPSDRPIKVYDSTWGWDIKRSPSSACDYFRLDKIREEVNRLEDPHVRR